MTISTIQQIMQVTDVDMISVTEAVEDSGAYTREIRVYGVASPGSGSRPLLFTLRVTGADANKIALTAPAQTF